MDAIVDEALELMKRKGTFFVPTRIALRGVRERYEKGPSSRCREILSRTSAAPSRSSS
jgi:hypothetical protein